MIKALKTTSAGNTHMQARARARTHTPSKSAMAFRSDSMGDSRGYKVRG